MADAQLKLSRRTLLGAACAAPVLPRHAGLDPASTFFGPAGEQPGWTPDQVRGDENAQSFAVTVWDRAVAALQKAEAALEAAAKTRDEDLYDRLGDRHDRALERLLTAPAPHAAALADKLDLFVHHQAWELGFADSAWSTLRQDARRLAQPEEVRVSPRGA